MGRVAMTQEPIVSTQPLHLINDGGAFDPGRHPSLPRSGLYAPQYNCVVHHVLSVSDVPDWEYQQRLA